MKFCGEVQLGPTFYKGGVIVAFLILPFQRPTGLHASFGAEHEHGKDFATTSLVGQFALIAYWLGTLDW